MAWEIFYGIGALLLLGALVYGMIQYRTRNRANDRITEEATRAQYQDPAHYEQKRAELQKDLRPSR